MSNEAIKSKAQIRAEKLLPGNQDFTSITNDIAGVPEQKKTPIQWWLLFGFALSLLAIFAGSVGFLIWEGTGMEKSDVLAVVENFMHEVKTNMESGENVYLRGFGSFVLKKRAEKTGRNISKNTTLIIPAHYIPAFKPAKVFADQVKSNVSVK